MSIRSSGAGGLSRRARLIFWPLALVLVVLSIEAGSLVLLRLAHGQWSTWAGIHSRQIAIVGEDTAIVGEDTAIVGEDTAIVGEDTAIGGEDSGVGDQAAADRLQVDLTHEAVHPYQGFVLDRGYRTAERLESGGQEALDFGFDLQQHDLQQQGVFQPSDPDRPVVAITGGSVAFGLARAVSESLRDELVADLPGFDQAVVLNLALPGYKQPQQLITLSYLWMLGAHFDLVINLDGFNEIVLPVAENIPTGVSPFYPRLWSFRAGELEPGLRVSLGELAFLDQQRRSLARRAARAPFRFSLTSGLIWTLRDRSRRRAMQQLEEGLRRGRDELRESTTVAGPPWSNDDEMTYAAMARAWARSSRQMHLLAEGLGIGYFHFLQPNQYLPGSKPMGAEERRIAIEDGHVYGRHIASGYPYLIEQGRELVEQGVRFTDLTDLFSEVEAPVYQDACCHLNALGETLVVEAIARAIRQQLAPLSLGSARASELPP